MLFTALFMGFLGSLHCVGMCGPLVLAFPSNRISKKFVLGRITYNLGRTLTYTTIGFIIGSLGKGVSFFVSQQNLSIITGTIIVLVVLLSFQKTSFSIPFLSKFNQSIRKKIGHYMSRQSIEAQFLFGLFNGLLPCGLVFLALSSSLAMGSPVGSAAFMAMFGLGTIPAMLSLAISKGFLSKSRLLSITKLNTYIALFIGVLFILRGLDLGIPYLSPEVTTEKTVNCCHSEEQN